jgi:hypothetical protein
MKLSSSMLEVLVTPQLTAFSPAWKMKPKKEIKIT